MTRFWELLLGCLLAYGARDPKGLLPFTSRKRVADAVSVVGIALIAVATFTLDKTVPFPGASALLPTVGSVFLLGAGPEALVNRVVLRNRILVGVGLISYPLYLWHWPLLSFARIVSTPSVLVRFALIVSSFVLAWLTWKFVETPLRARGARNRSADIAALSGALAVICVAGVALLIDNGVPGRLPAKTLALADDVGGLEVRRDDVPGPAPLRAMSECVQSRPGRADAAVVGDSHAGSLYVGLADVDRDHAWLAIADNSCPPTLGITVLSGAVGCAEKMRLTFDYLTGPEGPETVVLAFFGEYMEATDVAADHVWRGKGPSQIRLVGPRPDQSKEEVLAIGLENAVEMLVEHHKRVFLMVDVPELPFFPRDCVERPLFTKRTDCSVSRAAVDQRQLGLRRVVARLQERFPTLGVFDPLPLLCGPSECTPVLPDFSFYQDSHHLSRRGSALVAARLLHFMASAK